MKTWCVSSVFLPPIPDESVFQIRSTPEDELCGARLAGHAVATLHALSPFLLQLPSPLSDALHENTMLRDLGVVLIPDKSMRHINHRYAEFSEPSLDLWAPEIGKLPAVAAHQDIESENEAMEGHLRVNMEKAYDSVLSLYRLFRGDLGRPRELDPENVRSTVAGLSLGSVRGFAGLFLHLMICSVLSPSGQSDGLPDSLDTRDIGDGTAPTPDVGARAGQSNRNKCRGRQGSLRGKLDSIPRKVRKHFATNRSETFFFEFLVLADCHCFMYHLKEQLCARLSSALSTAAQARNNADFTEAVLEARLMGKFLSLALHFVNWSESVHHKSGDAADVGSVEQYDGHVDKEVSRSPSYGMDTYHVMYAEAHLRSVIDLSKLMKDGRATGSTLAALATAAVVQIMLTLTNSDPVARCTTWFNDAVAAVQEAARDADALLSVLCEGLLQSLGAPLQDAVRIPQGLVEKWRTWGTRIQGVTIGDHRFMRECTPQLVHLCASLLCDMRPLTCIVQSPCARLLATRRYLQRISRSGNQGKRPHILVCYRLLSMTSMSVSRLLCG